jgi:channel protein (hemolysin III family)
MKAFIHNDAAYGFRPRHPLVCALDIFGLVTALMLIALYRPGLAVLTLPVAVALQYVASLVYHWLPYSLTRRRIDQVIICVLIGATFVPYWGTKLPSHDALFRISLVVVAVAFSSLIVWRCILSRPHVVSGLYALFAASGVIATMYDLPRWLPPLGICGFWVGVICYLVQQVIHILHKPDLYPGLFGHAELRHVFLVGATTTHILVVTNYL